MDSYTDKKLIQRYLTATPSLHPRRTLDQAYYWTLKDTRKRDRDQVVYRATAPNRNLLQHVCLQEQMIEDNIKSTTCLQCLENVRKIPRIVMVDQLWMWVLDESNFLLFFHFGSIESLLIFLGRSLCQAVPDLSLILPGAALIQVTPGVFDFTITNARSTPIGFYLAS